MSPPVFSQLLQKELEAGFPLQRAMRRLRHLIVAILIERELTGRSDLNEVLDTISAFAEFAVKTHLSHLSSELAEAHGIPIGHESGMPQELIVLGMGKLGGYELNVSSDIDLIFVYPEGGETQTTSPEQKPLSNHEFFIKLGKQLIRALSDITEDGFTFRVDMALRPNGGSGPLAASFSMLEEYLIAQGREWERYAWIKARALTGRPEDIADLEQIVRPFVYRRYLDFGAIDALRNMHAQIRAEVTRQELRHPERNHNVKLGRGGIREIEFLAQVFQLIRGGRDSSLRDRSTRHTLRTLAQKSLLPENEVDQLLQAYYFLRNLEHRLQYLDDSQTHTLPVHPDDRLIIANMMGYPDTYSLLAELGRHKGIVATQFDAMFSNKKPHHSTLPASLDPVLINPALPEADNIEAIATHLSSLGFEDTEATARRLLLTWKSPRLQSLPESSRSKMMALIHAYLPLIASIAETRSITLGRFLDFLETIARRAAYLALLTEYPHTLGRIIKMMNASDWAAKYLTRHPILLDELLDDRSLKSSPDWPAFSLECQRQLNAASGDTEQQMNVLRDMHHAQLFRLLAQDLEGDLTVEKLADHLSALADVLVEATIGAAWQTVRDRHREVPQFAVIAYGKLGGKELGYASDLDLIFLYDDDHPDAPLYYAKLAQRFITWMTSHTPAGILFDIDIALRPDGASGLLVSSLAAFEKYQLTSAWSWEHQALTRARFCAGDVTIGNRFETIRQTVLQQPRNVEKLIQDVTSMRKKMREAHPNRSAYFDLKHDEGGMIDIEFIVQFLVLCHAAQYPQLTADIGNIGLLKLCGELNLIDHVLAEDIANAYRTYRKLQHQIRLQEEDRMRIEKEKLATEAEKVKQLWHLIFG